VRHAFIGKWSLFLRGIEARGRFQLLKRFIAHGSLLPPWEHKFTNSPPSNVSGETSLASPRATTQSNRAEINELTGYFGVMRACDSQKNTAALRSLLKIPKKLSRWTCISSPRKGSIPNRRAYDLKLVIFRSQRL
jgi:hypothetical protein